jgi:hypothetical protein
LRELNLSPELLGKFEIFEIFFEKSFKETVTLGVSRFSRSVVVCQISVISAVAFAVAFVCIVHCFRDPTT